ncbi:hypothetical protein F5144DRAFT_569209 [Chaetomium tenue]|uniref:Uncharacterized protein n=1 Tax=Chaetomium tenue TaxID=1854479 RepID=A0ACB7PCY1_9PEZI|nr:hypothetical protein F5144DRAFT_569209 [Chaetomium globosum]
MKIEDLEQNGIALSEVPARKGDLPRHIERVRAFLLDFACTLVDGLDEDGDVCIEDYVLERRDLEYADRKLREEYKTIRSDARILHWGRDREAEWQTFFLMNFFRPLVKEARVRDEDTRNVARAKFYYEFFESAQSRPWTLFRKKKEDSDENREKGFRQDDRENLTEPKPDWVAFFPIYNFPGERIPTSTRWQLMRDPKPALVENFSPATLQHLARHGVQSNTANIFRKDQTLKNIIMSDCLCFPWLIVEHKKAGEMALEEKCHCQAANAGTAAVMMLETLARIVPGVEEHTANEYIPPVVTMTTVDKIVRVWITYCCEQQSDDHNNNNDTTKYKMACIWRGDMTLVSDLIKLRAILENTHTWAMREQRPRISAYIDLWKYKYPTTTTATATTGQGEVEDDQATTASLAPSLAHLTLDARPGDLVPAPPVGEQVREAVLALLDDGMSTPELGSEESDGGDELGSEDELESEDGLDAEEGLGCSEDVEDEDDVENDGDVESEEGVGREDNVESEEDVESEEEVSDEESHGVEEHSGREEGLGAGDESTWEGSPGPEELTEEEESIGEDLTDDEPLTWTGALTWGPQTIEGELSMEEQPAAEESPVPGEPRTHEEPVVEEPPSTPPRPQRRTSPKPQIPASRVLQDLASGARVLRVTHQNTGLGHHWAQPGPFPETTTWIGGTHPPLRHREVFKKGIYLPYAWVRGGRIKVKLPDPESKYNIPVPPPAAPAPTPPGLTRFESVARSWIYPPTRGGDDDQLTNTRFEFKSANVKPVELEPSPFRFSFAAPGTPPTWPPTSVAQGATMPPTPPSLGNNNMTGAFWRPGGVNLDCPGSPSAGRSTSIFSMESMRGTLPPTPEPTPGRERQKPLFDFSTP